ncbi:hypothetical protein D9619_003897 [Psilocybe cf. subviscida]|uniref:Uncharacterized protein n=1 Tax=Psilocybe cf. subviscida TaxID=2480587 RepID=A0A8H5BQI4_9AGAR|nr:hypothetical protein D9619_003897 [Psilocybe cf. subviscida]
MKACCKTLGTKPTRLDLAIYIYKALLYHPPVLPALTFASIGNSGNVLNDMLVTYPHLDHDIRVAALPRISMGQESQKAMRLQAFRGYQVTKALCEGTTKENWKFMHCAPRKGDQVQRPPCRSRRLSHRPLHRTSRRRRNLVAQLTLQDKQANLWKQLEYILQDRFDAGGANTKQVSRTLEHAFNDFAISQVAKAIGKTEDEKKYLGRAINFLSVWNFRLTVPDSSTLVSSVMQRFANGTFNFKDPRHCSIHEPAKATCLLDAANRDGFYVGRLSNHLHPTGHREAHPASSMQSFTNRLDVIFNQSCFDSTDELSQQKPFMYHYANRPGLSTQRSRQVIAQFLNTSGNGFPGNDGAHTRIHNSLQNFQGNPTTGTGGNIFVKSVAVNGKPYKSNCFLNWDVLTSVRSVYREWSGKEILEIEYIEAVMSPQKMTQFTFTHPATPSCVAACENNWHQIITGAYNSVAWDSGKKVLNVGWRRGVVSVGGEGGLEVWKVFYGPRSIVFLEGKNRKWSTLAILNKDHCPPYPLWSASGS